MKVGGQEHCIQQLLEALHLQFILQSVILEREVLLEAVAPARLHVVMHYVVIEIYIRSLLILFIGELGLLMPLHNHKMAMSVAR